MLTTPSASTLAEQDSPEVEETPTAEITRTPRNRSDNQEGDYAFERYNWDFTKGELTISSSVAFVEDDSEAFSFFYDEADWRGADYNFSTWRELEAPQGLYGTVRAFEGTIRRENRTPTWREAKLYMGAKGTHGVFVITNADESDALWVVRSLLADGVPVTPFGFKIIDLN